MKLSRVAVIQRILCLDRRSLLEFVQRVRSIQERKCNKKKAFNATKGQKTGDWRKGEG